MKRRSESLARLREYRRYWQPDLVLAGLLVGIAALLSIPAIDLAISRSFYLGGVEPGWPAADRVPWIWFYKAPPLIILIIVPTCVAYLLLSLMRRGGKRYRLHSLYLLLALWIGNALIVEGILKLNWGRPRPLQVLEFGGWLDFLPAWIPGVAGRGHSFCSGHSAIAFYLTAFYFLLRRRHRVVTRVVLAAALAFGTGMGIARIRVGAHFASDVAWSAVIAMAVNLLLYYAVFNIPAAEDARTAPPPGRRAHGWLAAGILALLSIQGLVLTISPVHASLRYVIPSFHPGQPGILQVTCAVSPIELRLESGGAAAVSGELFGRGVPGSVFRTTYNPYLDDGVHGVAIACRPHGRFFESHGWIRIDAPLPLIQQLTVNAGSQTVTVAPFSQPPDEMILLIAAGRLNLPPGWQAIPVVEGRPDQGIRLVRQ